MPAGWAAGAMLVGGALQADAAGKAADQQADAAGQSINEQRRQYDTTRSDNATFLQTGTSANRRLAQLLGVQSTPDENDPRYLAIKNQVLAERDKAHQDMYGFSINDPRAGPQNGGEDQFNDQVRKAASDRYIQQFGESDKSAAGYGSLLNKFTSADMEADPVYQSGLKFGLDRGTEGINSRATAGGMFDSGATLKALTQFGNDYGSNKANESYNRFNNDKSSTFNMLSGVSGTGQVASGQVAAAGANMANNVSNSLEGAGNARAAGVVGGANAWGNAAANAGSGYQNYDSNKRLQALLDDRRYMSTGGAGNNYWDVGGIDANNYNRNYG